MDGKVQACHDADALTVAACMLLASHHTGVLVPTGVCDEQTHALEVQEAAHLDRSAERHLAIALSSSRGYHGLIDHPKWEVRLQHLECRHQDAVWLAAACRVGRAQLTCEKCMSPMLKLAPSTKTGKYTLQPLDRFLMSQFPPFSRPGICTWLSAASRMPSASGGSHVEQDCSSRTCSGARLSTHAPDQHHSPGFKYADMMHCRQDEATHRASSFRCNAVEVRRSRLDLAQHRVVRLRQQGCAAQTIGWASDAIYAQWLADAACSGSS